jgi:hypothetical protein
MRSFSVVAGEAGLVQQFTNLRHDARGGANLHVHQQLGAIALPTNPTNGQTLTLDINGTNVVLTFVSAIGTAAGNVLIGASAAATLANLLALLNQPRTTTATGVALSAANQLFVSYLIWPLSGTTITPCSNNTSLYAPLSSFGASTTVTGGSYTAQTMQLYVEPGVVYVNGTRVIFSGGSTPTVTTPSGNPRIDVLTIDNTGTLAWTTGTEASSPSAPTYPANKAALCELYNVVGETQLLDNGNQASGQGYILNDVRPFLQYPFNPGAIPASLLPSADDTYNLGGASYRWGAVYAAEFYGDASNMTGLASNDITDLYTAGMNGSAGDAMIALPYSSVAVTLDAKNNYSGSSASSFTQSFTVGSNSNRVLVVAIEALGSVLVSGITYNGVALSQITHEGINGGVADIWYLEAPATGANNLVITLNTTGSVNFNIYSYYNAAQTSTPEANAKNTGGGTQSLTLTPLTNGSLIFAMCAAGGALSGASSNAISGGACVSADTGGIYPMATQTISAIGTGNSGAVEAISIAPFMSSVTTRVYKGSSLLASTCASFIGFANAAYTAATSVRVIIGGTAGNLSGLTIGAQYYLNDTSGSIGPSPGTTTRKVGIALTATTLLITNLW